MASSAVRLVRVLKELGYESYNPHNVLRPSNLEWMFDDGNAREMLEWITANLAGDGRTDTKATYTLAEEEERLLANLVSDGKTLEHGPALAAALSVQELLYGTESAETIEEEIRELERKLEKSTRSQSALRQEKALMSQELNAVEGQLALLAHSSSSVAANVQMIQPVYQNIIESIHQTSSSDVRMLKEREQERTRLLWDGLRTVIGSRSREVDDQLQHTMAVTKRVKTAVTRPDYLAAEADVEMLYNALVDNRDGGEEEEDGIATVIDAAAEDAVLPSMADIRPYLRDDDAYMRMLLQYFKFHLGAQSNSVAAQVAGEEERRARQALLNMLEPDRLSLNEDEGQTYRQYVLELARMKDLFSISMLNLIQAHAQVAEAKAYRDAQRQQRQTQRGRRRTDGKDGRCRGRSATEATAVAAEKECLQLSLERVRLLRDKRRRMETEVLPALLRDLSETNASKALVPGFAAVTRRQDYFFDKQQFVIAQLNTQFCRHVLINSAYEHERRLLEQLLVMLDKAHTAVSVPAEALTHRLDRYATLRPLLSRASLDRQVIDDVAEASLIRVYHALDSAVHALTRSAPSSASSPTAASTSLAFSSSSSSTPRPFPTWDGLLQLAQQLATLAAAAEAAEAQRLLAVSIRTQHLVQAVGSLKACLKPLTSSKPPASVTSATLATDGDRVASQQPLPRTMPHPHPHPHPGTSFFPGQSQSKASGRRVIPDGNLATAFVFVPAEVSAAVQQLEVDVCCVEAAVVEAVSEHKLAAAIKSPSSDGNTDQQIWRAFHLNPPLLESMYKTASEEMRRIKEKHKEAQRAAQLLSQQQAASRLHQPQQRQQNRSDWGEWE